MNTDLIIVVIAVAAALIGAATAYFILRSKQTSTAENREDNQHKIEELETIITSKDQELNKLLESTEKLKQKIEKQKKELSDADNLKSLLQSGDENAIATALKNEIDKLKKELQDVEDEIENLEDESNSYKKKYNEQRSKVSEAELKIEQCENSLKELQTNLEATEEELKNTTAILDKKNEAIDFVNEILQAKDADNKDVKDINQKIRDIENFVENDLCSVFAQLKVWTQKEQQEAKNRIWQWANLQRKTWLQGKKVIAFVGEFSAGKTSIVNRILSQDNDNAPKLPVSSKATTAIATYISYGSDFNSQFTDPNGKLKNISKETFEKVNKEILQEVNVSPVITYFVMSYTNENLRDLSILDTPGFSSNDKEDAQRTADVIKEADALFWVFDANTGEINQTSLNIIREHLQDLPLYIIINKADTKSPNELEKLRKHIQSTIQKNNISVVDYILFSQKTPLNELMTTIRNVPQGNRKDEYVFNLYTDINKKLNTLNTACQTSRTKLLEAKKRSEAVLFYLEEHIEQIVDNCKDVGNMPELHERWFGSDYFKLSKEGYHDFIEKLEMIVTTAQNDILDSSIELQDKAKVIQNVQNDYDKRREERNLLNEALERFRKVLMNWNPQFKDYYQQRKNNNKNDNTSNLSYEHKDNLSTKSSYSKNEKLLMNELRNLNNDLGYFTDDNIPTIISLAEGYNISAERAINMAKSLKWE